MAKRFLVIETEDDNLIDKFQQVFVDKVVGIYRAPTLFCEGACASAGRRVTGFKRGKRWGWWVCSVCLKPSKGWGSNHQAVVSSGRNLIDDEE